MRADWSRVSVSSALSFMTFAVIVSGHIPFVAPVALGVCWASWVAMGPRQTRARPSHYGADLWILAAGLAITPAPAWYLLYTVSVVVLIVRTWATLSNLSDFNRLYRAYRLLGEGGDE